MTTHINITEEDVDLLISAIETIAKEHGVSDESLLSIEDHQVINPIYTNILRNRRFKVDIRDVLAADSEELPSCECLGRISADIKYKCPPVFPVLVYGEEILE